MNKQERRNAKRRNRARSLERYKTGRTQQEEKQTRYRILWECPINTARREEHNRPQVYDIDTPAILFPETMIEATIACGACHRACCLVIADNEIIKTRRQRLKMAKRLCRERVKRTAKAKARRKT